MTTSPPQEACHMLLGKEISSLSHQGAQPDVSSIGGMVMWLQGTLFSKGQGGATLLVSWTQALFSCKDERPDLSSPFPLCYRNIYTESREWPWSLLPTLTKRSGDFWSQIATSTQQYKSEIWGGGWRANEIQRPILDSIKKTNCHPSLSKSCTIVYLKILFDFSKEVPANPFESLPVSKDLRNYKYSRWQMCSSGWWCPCKCFSSPCCD